MTERNQRFPWRETNRLDVPKQPSANATVLESLFTRVSIEEAMSLLSGHL
jgi:hypothetical protein